MMSPDDPRHGSEAGYSAHNRAGEQACDRCQAAKNWHDKRRRVQGPALVQLPPSLHHLVSTTSLQTLSLATGISKCALMNIRKRGARARVKPTTLLRLREARVLTDVGTVRRVRALTALGWSSVEIAARSGVARTTVTRLRDMEDRSFIGRADLRDRIAATFDEVCMETPPHTRWSSRMKRMAAQNGWAPPLAWDNIDDPDEQPGKPTARSAGRPKVRDAVIEDFDWLVSQGVPKDDAASRVGVQLATIPVYRRRLDQEAS